MAAYLPEILIYEAEERSATEVIELRVRQRNDVFSSPFVTARTCNTPDCVTRNFPSRIKLRIIQIELRSKKRKHNQCSSDLNNDIREIFRYETELYIHDN